jgi:surfactin synthase thioesterase subunit
MTEGSDLATAAESSLIDRLRAGDVAALGHSMGAAVSRRTFDSGH